MIERAAARHVQIRVADLAIAVSSRDDALAFVLDDVAERFRDTSPTPDVALSARWGDLRSVTPTSRPRFDSGGVWSLHDTAQGLFILCKSAALAPHPYKSLQIDRSLAHGEIVFDREALGARSPVAPFEYPLDEIVMTHLLAAGRGAEMHGAGIVGPSGKGMLFVGASGAGKSTMTRLWLKHRDARVLSDDRIIVRAAASAASGFVMHGTPWHGEAHLAMAASARLDAVFLLRHAPKNDVRVVRGARATARLFACAFPPLYDRAALDFTLEFLASIVRAVPIFELDVLPDANVVAFVESIA